MSRRPLFAAATALVTMFLGSAVHSQAIPAAKRSGGEIRVGLEYSNANTDEFLKRIGGFSAYASYSLLPHFAIEGDVHLLQFFTPNDYAQRSYEGGGRFYYRYRRYEPYVKFMGGLTQTVQQSPYGAAPGTPDTYGMFSGTFGLDVLLPKKFVARGEFEKQILPAFSPNDLEPSIVSVGIAYRIR